MSDRASSRAAHSHTVGAAGAHSHAVSVAGDHTHALAGGDRESRPVNAYVNYLIKF